MLIEYVQRWRERRDSYRPVGEPFDPRAFEVAAIPGDTEARTFVERHHYSGTFPAARRRFGLYTRGALVGVAVFSVPMVAGVLAVLRCPPAEALELGRFVLLDDVGANAESWFLARCLRPLEREGFRGVVTFADPEPRTTAMGATVFGGHLGVIYQASSAIYLGRATPRTLRLLPDGTVLSARALSKIRGRERGWRYAVGQLVAHGALEPGDEDLGAWLARELPRITRGVRHHGNHKYVIPFAPRLRRGLEGLGRPYPKLSAALAA